MATITFTAHLHAVAPDMSRSYAGATVGALLDAVAADFPRLRNYVLDDQGRVRKHIAIFVDGVLRPRENALALPLQEDSDVYVLQALSGG